MMIEIQRVLGRLTMVSRATLKSRLTALAGLVIAAAAGAALARTDLLLNRGFGNALDARRPGLTFEVVTAKEQPQGAAGDEGYWLTRAEVESPTPFGKPLAIGDRITISGHDGAERQLEVVDLKAIGGSARAGQMAQPRLLLVTCHIAGETGAKAPAPVRFIVEAEPAIPATPAPAKAL
jgi:hypothetical protein